MLARSSRKPAGGRLTGPALFDVRLNGRAVLKVKFPARLPQTQHFALSHFPLLLALNTQTRWIFAQILIQIFVDMRKYP
jgi:hypothetical protein